MIKFLHHLFTPHCPDCKADARELKEELKLERAEQREDIEHSHVCESCQTLTRQLEISNAEKERLLDKLLELTNPEKQIITQEPARVSMPRAIPWNMRRQMLEAEDRRAAQLRRQAPKQDTVAPVVERADIKELEKELEVEDGATVEETTGEDPKAENQAV